MVLAGCVDEAPPPAQPDAGAEEEPAPDAAEPPAHAELAMCTGRAFTAPAAAGFEHWTSDAAAALGDPRHYAQDVIARPGEPAHLAAKFAYGAVWKDLEDEAIAVFVDDCAGWVDAGAARTDDDGRIALDLTGLSVGVHEVRAVALGDATQAITTVWVLPAGTHVAVTDIDGTLTTSDTELFQEILDGSYVPEAYPGATHLTHAHAERGHVVVYVTGRPYWLLGITRAWLATQSFAAGIVHVADSNTDILPTDGSVGAYKQAFLESLTAAGYVLDLAYGNATTDVHAYLGAGVPATSQWIIGDNAGMEGTHAVADSWDPRAAEVDALPDVAQPF